MNKETIYTLSSPYRQNLNINGYRFGKGVKSVSIVGAIRGNEIQQLYVCSQLIKVLTELEKKGDIITDNEILVIPCVNPHSMNIEKRFWAVDNTDINRMFPGDALGETTKRIADGLFQKVSGYSYGIQFASSYMRGSFVPHVRMMDTGFQNASLANLFGFQFAAIRKPHAYDTTTLNYNWQRFSTHAFSVYTSETSEIDDVSAKQAVSAVLRFMSRMGIIRYNSHGGYISTIIREEELMNIKSPAAGIYHRLKKSGDEVTSGEVLSEVLDPCEGTVIAQIKSPANGILFFSHTDPTVMENALVYNLIKRLHQ